jgi:hypothetical protein
MKITTQSPHIKGRTLWPLTRLVFFLALTCTLHSNAQLSREGNGGAVIAKEGQYMTFFSAGKIKVLYQPESGLSDGLKQISGLQKLVDFTNNLEVLSLADRGELLRAIMPTEKRRYYNVDDQWLNSNEAKRILNEYRQLKGIDEELYLGALTDTFTGRTFLLPSFHRLATESQKAAILFHEAYWILHPEATYQEVINTEMAFQAYLENPQDENKLLVFAISFGVKPMALLEYAYKHDSTNGQIKEGQLIFGNRELALSFANLVGQKGIDCLDARSQYAHQSCDSFVIENVKQLFKEFPSSFFIKVMLRNFLASSFYFYKTWNKVPGHCDADEMYDSPLVFTENDYSFTKSYTFFDYDLGEPIWWLTKKDTCTVKFRDQP